MRAAIFLLLTVPLVAQPADDTCRRLFREAAAGHSSVAEVRDIRNVREQQGSVLGGSTVGPTTTTAVALVAGEAEGRGIISYTRQSGDHNWSLKASAPFSKTSGESAFATQDQLTGDLVVTAGTTWTKWDLEIEAYGNALCTACEQKAVALQDCNAKVLGNDASAELLFGTVAAKVWGGEASLGRKKREYFTAAGVADNESRTGTAISLYGGLLFQNGSGYLRLTAKQDFKEGDSVQRCEPVGTDLEKCKSLPLNEARRIDTVALATEGRFFFTNFAVAPSVAFEFQQSDTTIQLPVYLLRNDASALTGGVRLGWTSKNDVGFSAALFITKPLTP